MSLPIVAIIGRPNVGKSTLFNRIIRKRKAVVDPQPGVTRDRHYAEAEWAGRYFLLVDTGGYMSVKDGDRFADVVTAQSMVAAEEADVILFLTDAMTGFSEIENSLVKTFLQNDCKTILVANKIDDPSKLGQAWDLPNLGLGEPFSISALNGFQVGDLLEEVVNLLPEVKDVDEFESGESEDLSLAVIGAPNSGKSSLVNKLSGSQRMVVSDIPGTTRDSIDTVIQYKDKSIRLIDTAGLKRRRFGEKGLEFYCTLRAIRSLDRSEVAVIMSDASTGITQGDIRLVYQAVESGTGIMLAINKWDLLETDPKIGDRWLEEWRRLVHSLQWVPLVFISALTGRRVEKILDKAEIIAENRNQKLSTSDLNEMLISRLKRNPPPAVKGKYIKVKYAAQVKSSPPLIVVFASHAELIGKAYNRYVENQIRELFGFEGVPLKVVFRVK